MCVEVGSVAGNLAPPRAPSRISTANCSMCARRDRRAWGWPVLLGVPARQGAPRCVIVTRQLYDYLADPHASPSALPLSTSCVRDLRDRHGLARPRHGVTDPGWWLDHIDELVSMSGEAFAKTYGVSVGAVSRWFHAVTGPVPRKPGRAGQKGEWRTDQAVLQLLRAERSHADVARELGITANAVAWRRKRLAARDTNGQSAR
jgi:hypothetical protein